MVGTKLLSVAKALPRQEVSNEDLVKRGLDTSDEWIFQRTGIKSRYIASGDESTSSLATKAAKQALESAAMSPKDIDLIVLATASADYPGFPAVSCQVQEALGCQNAVAFDITAACSGFNFALDVAQKYIETGSAKHALVIAADCLSKLVNWKDRGTCVLFGDGAGAVVLGASQKQQCLGSLLGSNGAYTDILKVGFEANQPKEAYDYGVVESETRILMDGRSVFKVAIETMVPAIETVLKEAHLEPKDIKKVVLHQANQRILSQLQQKCGFSEAQMVSVVHQYGNMSAASVPVALADTAKDLKPGDKLLCGGFGAGFTWGLHIIEWSY